MITYTLFTKGLAKPRTKIVARHGTKVKVRPNRSAADPHTTAPNNQPTKKIAIMRVIKELRSQTRSNCVTMEKCFSSVYFHEVRLMLHLRTSLSGKVPFQTQSLLIPSTQLQVGLSV